MPAILSYRNLGQVLAERAAGSHGVRFVSGSDDEQYIRYSDLYERALLILGYLQARGLLPGDQLVFQLEDNEIFICTFWACLLGGIVPVPLTVGRYDDHKAKLYNVWKILDNPSLITSDRQFQRISDYAESHAKNALLSDILSNTLVTTDYDDKNQGTIQNIDLDSTAFVQFSSGSTSAPKGVILTHRNLLTNIDGIIHGIQAPPQGDTFFSWMPLTHDMGIIGFHLTPVVADFEHYLMPTELFLKNPILWLRKITEHRISFSSSPNFGYNYVLKYFKPEKHPHIDLSSVRILVNGAEPISLELCRQFLRTFEPYGLKSTTMFPVYGLAEASLAVSFSAPEKELVARSLYRTGPALGQHVQSPNEEDAFSYVSVGTAVKGCEIRIVDGAKALLGDEQVGHIQIRGGNVTSGYYANATATAEACVGEGWFDTGDLGFLAAGSLFVTGREKDVIFVHGQNYYPDDIEKVLEQVDGFELGKVVVAAHFDHDTAQDFIIVFVLFRKKDVAQFMPLRNAVIQNIHTKLGLEATEILPVARIPKTTSGKVQRFKLVEAYLQGEFDAVIQEIRQLQASQHKDASRNQGVKLSAVEERLLQQCGEVLAHASLGINDNFLAAGGNSIKAAILSNEISKQWNVDVSLMDILDSPDLWSLADKVAKAAVRQASPLQRVGQIERHRASEQQARLFYLQQLAPDSTAYNIVQCFVLDGHIDVELLKDVWQALCERHDSLRMSFFLEDDEIFPSIAPAIEIDVNDDIIAEPSEIDFGAHIRPFDLNRSPLFRISHFACHNEKSVLLFDFHHIMVDGLSVKILIDEMCSLYNGQTLAPAAFQYLDFTSWLRNNPELISNMNRFWAERYEDNPHPLDIKSDFTRPKGMDFRGDSIKWRLKRKTTDGLRGVAQRERVTLFVLFLGIYNVLLSKLTGQDDIVVGVPSNGRYHADASQIVGMFVASLPIRSRLNHGEPFVEFLRRLWHEALSAVDNQGFSFDALVASLNIARAADRQPLFETMYVYQDFATSKFDLGGHELCPMEIPHKTSKFDLTLEIVEGRDDIECLIEYRTDLFEKRTIERFAFYFDRIIEAVLQDSAIKIAEIDLVSLDDRWGSFSVGPWREDVAAGHSSVTQWLTSVATKCADQPAVLAGSQSTTYFELSKKAEKVERLLTQNKVKQNSVVAVSIPPSVDFIAAVLGVWRAGAAYLPLDIDWPAERTRYVLADSNAQAILVTERHSDFEANCPILELTSQLTSPSDSTLCHVGEPSDLAYVIYTSGTTGRPKGVMTDHDNLLNYLSWAVSEYAHGESVLMPFFTSPAFDLTITSIFLPLLTGGTVVVEQDIQVLLDSGFSSGRHDVVKLTPSHLRAMLKDSGRQCGFKKPRCASTIKFIVGGEDFQTGLASEVTRMNPRIRQFNEYGPTEATVGCMLHEFEESTDRGSSVSIGDSIQNTQVYLLGSRLKPVAEGIVGELYISGRSVSRGYLNNPELTAERFVANPFVEDAMMYKTGDLARKQPGGSLKYIGRVDEQVKVRGYRVELKEIEARLTGHPAVNAAVVLSSGNADVSGNGLTGFVVLNQAVTLAVLRKCLSIHLPHYMIPTSFLQVPDIPLTKHGKVDRSKLLAHGKRLEPECEAAEQEFEPLVIGIWQRVLGKGEIGRTDNFFELGGDSIKALQVVARLKADGLTTTVQDILSFQTIAELCSHIQARSDSVTEQGEPLSGSRESGPIERWFLRQGFAQPEYYFQSVLLDLKEELEPSLIELALSTLVAHHDGLRSNLSSEHSEIFYNQAHIDRRFVVDRYDLSDIEVAELPERVGVLATEFKRKWDLSSDLLFKAALIQSQRRYPQLLIIAHHLVIDGFSWRILLEDFVNVYQALASQKQLQLPIRTTSLRDWYGALNHFADTNSIKDEQDYWREVEATAFRLPQDYYPAACTCDTVRTTTRYLQTEETEFLITKAQAVHHVAMTAILLTALARAVRRWTRGSECLIELENHGRHLPNIDVSRTVGWFTVMHPLRIALPKEGIASEINHVKGVLGAVPHNGIAYSVLKYLKGGLASPTQEMKAVRFNYLGQFDDSVNSELFSLSSMSAGADVGPENHLTAQVEMNLAVLDASLKIDIRYSGKAFKSSTIESFADAFVSDIRETSAYLRNGTEVQLSPADFDTVELDHKELDSLFIQ